MIYIDFRYMERIRELKIDNIVDFPVELKDMYTCNIDFDRLSQELEPFFENQHP